jgi:hypothetical protein
MRRRLLVAALVCLPLASACGAHGGPSPTSSAHNPPSLAAPAPPAAAAPSGDRSEAGARAAAIAYATASQDWLYLSDADIDRQVRALATPAAASSLSAQMVANLGAARDALAASTGRVWWLVRPLASNVERFDGTTARVDVWTVTVLSATGVALPQADWMRVGVELSWVDTSWRVQAVDTTPGPTPATGTSDRPWQAAPFDAALDGFQRVGDETAR